MEGDGGKPKVDQEKTSKLLQEIVNKNRKLIEKKPLNPYKKW